MSRQLDNWLDAYLEYTNNSESPLSYHTWCGLSIMAGAMQRKVYLRWGLGQIIYPNLYIVLIGPSGRTRKGVAIGIAKELLKDVPGITITPESSSGRQAMILAMKRATVNFQDPSDGKVKWHCSVTSFSEELSVFLGQGDISYLASLTDWYDSKDDWEYETVGRGKDSLHGLCLNFLGGTAPDWIQSMIPYEAVGGGFTSRVIFIVETEKRKLVPEHTMTDREIQLQEALQNDLERISKMAGEVLLLDETKKLYVDWYIEQDKLTSAGQPAVDDPRFAGYCERRATHLRKLMMICSAARSDNLIVEPSDFKRALKLLESAEVNMARTFGGFGKSKTSDATETIKDYIQKVRITTRKTVLARFYRDVDAFTLSQIESTLVQMGFMRAKPLIQQMDKAYEYIDPPVRKGD